MHTSLPVHSKVTSTPTSSSSLSRMGSWVRVNISAARALADSSELRKGSVLDGVAMPSNGVEEPELLLLLVNIKELLEEVWSGRGTT